MTKTTLGGRELFALREGVSVHMTGMKCSCVHNRRGVDWGHAHAARTTLSTGRPTTRLRLPPTASVVPIGARCNSISFLCISHPLNSSVWFPYRFGPDFVEHLPHRIYPPGPETVISTPLDSFRPSAVQTAPGLYRSSSGLHAPFDFSKPNRTRLID